MNGVYVVSSPLWRVIFSLVSIVYIWEVHEKRPSLEEWNEDRFHPFLLDCPPIGILKLDFPPGSRIPLFISFAGYISVLLPIKLFVTRLHFQSLLLTGSLLCVIQSPFSSLWNGKTRPSSYQSISHKLSFILTSIELFPIVSLSRVLSNKDFVHSFLLFLLSQVSHRSLTRYRIHFIDTVPFSPSFSLSLFSSSSSFSYFFPISKSLSRSQLQHSFAL